MNNLLPSKMTIGWREWMALPDLGIPAVKAKIDTGARTSSLHAFTIEPFKENGKKRVRFRIHPLQRRTDIELICVADVFDHRMVSDSGGHSEMRYVIKSKLVVGSTEIEAEITLTDRDTMRFRMLLGRTALADKFLVDTSLSCITGPRPKKIYGLKKKRRKM
ncbi:MAG: RimK/LysX family protein [Proteobacteria bacterium]|nr:RimK/LysX family protein [Pseudomonadota bacterium]MBU1696345.1 RimK/LysX family protein [Pseudomonadota bacterium]